MVSRYTQGRHWSRGESVYTWAGSEVVRETREVSSLHLPPGVPGATTVRHPYIAPSHTPPNLNPVVGEGFGARDSGFGQNRGTPFPPHQFGVSSLRRGSKVPLPSPTGLNLRRYDRRRGTPMCQPRERQGGIREERRDERTLRTRPPVDLPPVICLGWGAANWRRERTHPYRPGRNHSPRPPETPETGRARVVDGREETRSTSAEDGYGSWNIRKRATKTYTKGIRSPVV